jgi:hypothetical protein
LKRKIKEGSNEFLYDGIDGNRAEMSWRLHLSDRRKYINTRKLRLDQGSINFSVLLDSTEIMHFFPEEERGSIDFSRE